MRNRTSAKVQLSSKILLFLKRINNKEIKEQTNKSKFAYLDNRRSLLKKHEHKQSDGNSSISFLRLFLLFFLFFSLHYFPFLFPFIPDFYIFLYIISIFLITKQNKKVGGSFVNKQNSIRLVLWLRA